MASTAGRCRSPPGSGCTGPTCKVFVVMGDGDCTSIGAAHWVHAMRYNLDMSVMLLDNAIYGLTKNQTSPTTPQGFPSNTQPHGSWLPPLNPLSVALGVTNASFVAQTAEWAPSHLYATLRAALCPSRAGLRPDPAAVSDVLGGRSTRARCRIRRGSRLLVHDDGVVVPELEKIYTTQVAHDPHDLDAARRIAGHRPIAFTSACCSATRRGRGMRSMRRVPPRTADERLGRARNRSSTDMPSDDRGVAAALAALATADRRRSGRVRAGRADAGRSVPRCPDGRRGRSGGAGRAGGTGAVRRGADRCRRVSPRSSRRRHAVDAGGARTRSSARIDALPASSRTRRRHVRRRRAGAARRSAVHARRAWPSSGGRSARSSWST